MGSSTVLRPTRQFDAGAPDRRRNREYKIYGDRSHANLSLLSTYIDSADSDKICRTYISAKKAPPPLRQWGRNASVFFALSVIRLESASNSEAERRGRVQGVTGEA